MRRLAALLLLCACSGGGGGGSSAPPPPPPPPPPPVSQGVVSGLSPFTLACGGNGGAAGSAQVNSEVEPHVAVNPRDGDHLIAVWQQDRWPGGGARGLLTGASLDGGTTWTFAQVPFSECSGGTFVRASDPWVTFSPDGTAYQSALVFSGGTFAPASSNAVAVSRSTDGGRTWSSPVILISDGGETFNDKETITADPGDARFVYAVWDRLRQGGNGPTFFARTIDGGATWEAARMILDPGPRSQTIGNLVRVLPDGTLVNLYTQIDEGPNDTAVSSVRVIRSTDRGASWSAPIVVSSHQPLGARDPTTGQRIRDGSEIVQMAAGPGATLHVVWQDGRFTGQRDGIAYSRSADGGLTWSAPTRVNADPDVVAFTPQVHVNSEGRVGVTYFDLRSDSNIPETLPTDYWLARSSDGAAWAETRVADPFDLIAGPVAGGALFLGDYMGLANAGATFLALYARTTGVGTNRTDLFLARIAASAPSADYAPGDAKRLVERDAEFRRAVSDNLRWALASRRARPEP